ncbi:MAG: type VI secretion system protein TssA [Deltaproteobacteria bacterium]|nr:type VI secretion system protein TssA [Deltaproteobacteria bacterium]
MSSARNIDLDGLLAPIPGDSPSGQSVRFAGPYDAIADARRADDDLNQGEWKRNAKVADWAAVKKLALETFATKSKDLQITAWLTEALVKLHGFAGLRDGLELLIELHRQFWETFFPEPEEGDLEARAGKIEWLNDRLPMAIREIALTTVIDGAAYSFNRYQESRMVDELGRKNPDAMQMAITEGKITGEQFDKAVAVGSRLFYEGLFADISQSVEQCAKLSAVVDEKYGKDAPSLLAIKKALEDCADLVGPILKAKRQLEPDQPAAAAQGNGMDPSDQTAAIDRESATPADQVINLASASLIQRNGMAGLSTPTDRAEALVQLEKIAEYFRRTEPHSPVAYLVQRAVRWGRMPLAEWLTDVISDEGVLTRVRETLGIKGSGEGGA